MAIRRLSPAARLAAKGGTPVVCGLVASTTSNTRIARTCGLLTLVQSGQSELFNQSTLPTQQHDFPCQIHKNVITVIY
jgi:hypothetical protein